MISKKSIYAFLIISLIGIAACVLTFFYADKIAVLNPQGLIAVKERDLMYLALGLMLLVVIPVFIMTLAIAWKYRADNTQAEYTPEWNHSVTAELVWWGFPLLIIIILSIVTWKSSHELDPYKPLESPTKPLTVQVVALEWKWLFIYPDYNIATVNFAQIPENTPINFEMTADAPMNSFWVPQLGGQMYVMPGMKSTLHLIADAPGEYSGSSANISGKGFAGMTFTVKATSQEEFEQWTKSLSQAPSLGQNEYVQLAKPSQYVPRAFYSLGKKDLFDWVLMLPMQMAETTMDSHKDAK